MNSAGERPRAAPWFCAASLALSAALSARLAFGGDVAYAFAAVAFAVAAALAPRFARGRLAGPLVALAALNLVTAVAELGLRSAGFRYVSAVEFGYPEPELLFELEPDAELFWKLPPGPGVNRLGFFGPDPAVPKPAGAVRWLMLGDSCAQLGQPASWPDLAARELAGDFPGLELVNLSMSGYSSHQGRVLAERHAAELDPDFVAVGYGWNDHWLAHGATDADKRVDPCAERLYRRFALLQATRCFAVSRGWRAEDSGPLAQPRVPSEGYRENLARIVATCRGTGARVVLLTIPSAYERIGVPGYVAERGFASSSEEAVARHREYNDIVRETARASGADLLDLAAELEGRPDVAGAFAEDGIHFSEDGRAAVAKRFADFVRSAGIATTR
jgi:lysophospholipase L1-like esterase